MLSLMEGTSAAEQCEPGLILPVWEPQTDLSLGDRFARGLVYFLAMLYMFIGVSIISDRFMASIEVITSKEKEIKIKKPSGETQIVVVRVWNETVANLTLMALGSSAPEILLSIIEIWAKKFEAGDLGPGTIVGSAAFNLLVIIAICVYVIPEGEFVTPGIIDVWEGVVTFLFFPLTVMTAYMADRRMLIYKYLSKQYRMNRRGVIVEAEGNATEMGKLDQDQGLRVFAEESTDENVKDFEDSRREFIRVLRDLRKKYPNLEPAQIEELARNEVLNKGPKSRAFYRMQATRKMMGGQNLMKKIQEKAASESSMENINQESEDSAKDTHITTVFFDPGHYTVMENVGTFLATVSREGGDLNLKVLVDYKTEDGTASGGNDYITAAGTLVFGPGERHKTIELEVLDDDVFEEDEHFYVRLMNPRFAEQVNGSISAAPVYANKLPEVQLASPFLATVIILDDDHCGIFNIADKDVETVESIGTYELKLVRWSGARGKVAVPYETLEGTAKPGKDYVHAEGEIIFENNETEPGFESQPMQTKVTLPNTLNFRKTIPIQIQEEDSYEKDVLFYVELKEPRLLEDTFFIQVVNKLLSRGTIQQQGTEYSDIFHKPGGPLNISMKEKQSLSKEEKIALEGWPKLGPDTRAQIRVKESKEFKNTVDKLVQRANASLLVGTSSWKEQFIEAITVNPGDDDEDGEEGEEKVPSCGDYVMHFLTIFWKIIFAFVPPTDIFGGYVAFVVSILVIGMLTAVIGDLASHLGCSVGMKDAVTAIVFVALGTSVPDILDGYVTFVVSIIGIGVLTAVIGDLASHLGCTVGLKDAVTAIAFVALGTSVPDTFASKVAAVQDEYADASIGNVTGSNAVNVFLGIGIAWTLAAVYHEYFKDLTGCQSTATYKCGYFNVPPGNLAFSVTLFCSVAVVAIMLMMLRRTQRFGGGELVWKPTKRNSHAHCQHNSSVAVACCSFWDT
ncbi:unnamed protein product [Allacma fusca]|uniref:Calx-beta domain-containing protein n=1 Tax=Allacma fusca TaxID=39272 RepID=A0A8J2M8X9_9HEXA|nr:unnamed protein product [Allacma fusca]